MTAELALLSKKLLARQVVPRPSTGLALDSLGIGEVDWGVRLGCAPYSPSPPTLSSDIIRTLIATMWTLGLMGKARVFEEVG